MATAVNFQLKGNSAKQDKGLVQEITATARVEGMTSTDSGWVTEALSATGLPASGSSLVLASGETLYLEGRNPSLIDGERTSATVQLSYKRRDGSSSETGGVPVLEGGTALKQIRTQKDRNGAPITVSHLWPDDSKATYPDGTPKAGTTEEVNAEIDVMVPMSTLSGEIIVQTSTPGAISQNNAGHLNSATWQGGAARTWMCTAVTFRLLDNTTTPPLYSMRFNFEYDDQTWDNDTTAVFIDPQTSQVPLIDAGDLPLPNGKEVVKVEYFPTTDFNQDF